MKYLLAVVFLAAGAAAFSQTRREDIYTDFVLYNKRMALEKDLRDRVVGRHFSAPLDSNSEDGYLSGCWAVEQFLFGGEDVMQGFDHLFAGYATISYDTRRALLEAVYAVAPQRYRRQVERVMASEGDVRLFALCAAYLFRADTGIGNVNALTIQIAERFPGYDTVPVLAELQRYMHFVRPALPNVGELFAWERQSDARPSQRGAAGPTRVKTIYSFQRWNRDYAGLAIVAYANGSFARDGNGRLQVFQQLARSGPGLPYFLTNGNTPQGVYRIMGTDISRTNFIGPTPNLQLLLPGEGRVDTLERYRELLPPGWRDYAPMMEAWEAGAIGRTAIIAHGTTIDPEYFKGKPWYPLTPTMGCLCAKELWNVTTGHPLVSEQNNLVNAFLSTPGRQGLLIVINLDDQARAVSREEVEALVRGAGANARGAPNKKPPVLAGGRER